MMLILADENVPGPVIRALRQRGHDVLSVREVIRGADDRSILDLAQREGRLVMTSTRISVSWRSDSGSLPIVA
jgi:predicted nuclease of predicted toxin-antitoxin system